MQKIIVLLLTLFYSCNTLSDARGDYNEVIVLTSADDKPKLFNQVNNLFSIFINTPNKEKIFKTKWINPSEFKDYLDYKNIFFISLENPRDSTIDILIQRFKKKYENNIFALSDLYANNQALIFLSTVDSISLMNDLKNYDDWILNNYNDNIEKYLSSYIYKNGINEELNNVIYEYFDIIFTAQKDFLIVKDDVKEKSFLWIGRGYPYRWVTFKKIKLSSDILLFDQFRKHVNIDMPNVKITDYYKNLLYEADDIIKIQGLYEEENSNTGGPFVSYVKLFREENMAFIVSGFVNNPGKNKLRLLKELELQIKNIKYGGNYEK